VGGEGRSVDSMDFVAGNIAFTWGEKNTSKPICIQQLVKPSPPPQSPTKLSAPSHPVPHLNPLPPLLISTPSNPAPPIPTGAGLAPLLPGPLGLLGCTLLPLVCTPAALPRFRSRTSSSLRRSRSSRSARRDSISATRARWRRTSVSLFMRASLVASPEARRVRICWGFGVVSGGVIVGGGLTRIDSCARVFKGY